MLAKALQGAALATQPAYIEDTFATYLYTGNGSTQTITNGIDLSGKGGLVWIKKRSSATGGSNLLLDTLRGGNKWISSNSTNGESTSSQVTFGSSGFDAVGPVDNAATYASWTFRKQAKFFDVVTYTGDGASNRGIPHNLGSTPGFILVKATSTTGDWYALHRVGNSGSWGVGTLNSTGTFSAPSPSFWGNGTTFTAPTSTTFTVSADGGNLTNGSGVSFVAYLFAHDAGGFGAAGTDNVISCGSYTGNGSATGPTINLGWEPQWLLVKPSTVVDNWNIIDNMRGATVSGSSLLYANAANAEGAIAANIAINATGFQPNTTNSGVNGNGQTYIYIAIRRGPMKTPTSGTSVFSPQIYTEIITNPTTLTTGWPTDLHLISRRTGTTTFYVADRLRGSVLGNENFLETPSTVAETDYSSSPPLFTSNTGIVITNLFNNTSGQTDISYQFRRAPGFFDVVCYTGTGANMTIAHNLKAAPELIIIKKRSAAGDYWPAYICGASTFTSMYLNSTQVTGGNAGVNLSYGGGHALSSAPTSSNFYLENDAAQTTNAATFVTYLFATLAGVSKVGSYQGNGTSKTIDCGFTAGARFVLIKRTDSTGDWYVWDTARGIVSGNDPHLSLNTTAAEVTTDDTIDPDNSGFIVNQVAATNVNVNNASYIFLAVS